MWTACSVFAEDTYLQNQFLILSDSTNYCVFPMEKGQRLQNEAHFRLTYCPISMLSGKKLSFLDKLYPTPLSYFIVWSYAYEANSAACIRIYDKERTVFSSWSFERWRCGKLAYGHMHVRVVWIWVGAAGGEGALFWLKPLVSDRLKQHGLKDAELIQRRFVKSLCLTHDILLPRSDFFAPLPV